MGIDGTKIVDSDFAWDIYDEFFELFDAGMSPPLIEARLTETYRGEILSELDREIFLSTLSECLWRVGHPTESHSEQLKAMIDAESTAALWEDLYPERKRVLKRFVAKLGKPRKTPLRPQKQRRPQRLLFEEGDYLVFCKKNGKKIPTIIWGIETRGGVCYVFVFPNLTRTNDINLIERFLDTTRPISNDDLAVFFSKNKRFKCVAVDHKACKPQKDRFRKFGARPFDDRIWQGSSFASCSTFECFEQYANEGGSRSLSPDELKLIGCEFTFREPR